MNDETLRQFEKELAELRPAEVSAALRDGVAAALDQGPLTLGDRVLAGFMGAGALAAAVIVGIVVLNVATESARPMGPSAAETEARTRIMQEYQVLLAQR